MRELFSSRKWSLEEFEDFIKAEPELFKLYKQDIVVGSAEYGNTEVLEYFLNHYKQYLESDVDLHERLKTTATNNSTLQVIMQCNAMNDWWDTLD